MGHFAQHLGDLALDSGARQEMARESFSIAERFTVTRMVEQTVGVYTTLLAGG